LEGVATGEKLDPALVLGLEKPLAAALQGNTSADEIYYQFENSDAFLMAIPVFYPDVADQVVGVVVFNMRDISTEGDRGNYFGVVVLRSLAIILVASVMVGATFGALTAEGLAGRFRRIAAASEAWSRGDFSTRIHEESSDEIGQLAGRLDGMAQELQELVEKRQELAIAQERNRLARDLHDSAKQLALAASFQIAAARELFDRDPQTASKHLADAENLVDKVRTELTDLIHELRSTQMDGRDFNDIVRTYAAEWAHSSGIGVQVDIRADENLPIEVEEVLYRILQEALANVARHSGARQAFVLLEQQNGEIQLSVRDEGVGFDEESVSSGMGLSSMQERAEAIGGFTRVNSRPGAGTEVRVVLPLAKKDVENDRSNQGDAGR
jgi:NarL family two-component system sensor histidine kinase LiaS